MSLVPLSGNPNIDGLLWGSRWGSGNPGTLGLSYGFADAFRPFSWGYQNSVVGFRPFNDAQELAVHDIIAKLDGLISSIFTFEPLGVQSNLTYGEARSVTLYTDPNTSQPVPGIITTATGIPPDSYFAPNYAHGDMFFNSTDYNQPQCGDYAYHTFLHETGHALGLKHGHVSQTSPDGTFVINALPANRDGMEFSVMTYRSEVGGPTDYYRNEQFGYAQTYMMNDIAALQYLYGADYSFHAGSTSYRWNSATGEMFIDRVGQGAPGANRVFLTIWDGGGIDTYDMSNYSTDLSVDLAPGRWSILSQVQLAVLNTDTGYLARANVFNALPFAGDMRSMIENAIGGSGADVLRGNLAANALTGNGSADWLIGLAGNDSLDGGIGADRLDGGIGFDLLVGGVGHDVIAGSVGNDRLMGGSGMDSLSGGPGNDVFAYANPGDGKDAISDFSSAASGNNDCFEFVGTGFGRLAAGALSSVEFQISTVGVAGADTVRFLFETDTGVLRFDPDGLGTRLAIVIATLQTGAQMQLNDILIV